MFVLATCMLIGRQAGREPLQLVFVAFILAAMLLILGFGTLFTQRKKAADRTQLKGTERYRIADVPVSESTLGAGMASITGLAKRGAGGLVKAPYSQRECIWAATIVEELERSGKHSTWVERREDVVGESFLIQDESGSAVVDARLARVYVARTVVAKSGAFNSPDARLREFYASHLIRHESQLGFNLELRVLEEVIPEGDTVIACGPYAHEAAEPSMDGYRGSARQRLRMGVRSSDADLLLSNKPMSSLLVELNTRALSFGLIALGTALGLGSLLAKLLFV
jgi:hypothetical protein